jgi:regulatory protein
VLDCLVAEGLQSDARFAENYARQRADKGFGPLRIGLELRQRGVEVPADGLGDEASGWAERAARVRSRRFGKGRPGDLRERARQARFLEYRGFTAEQIRQSLNGDEQ